MTQFKLHLHPKNQTQLHFGIDGEAWDRFTSSLKSEVKAQPIQDGKLEPVLAEAAACLKPGLPQQTVSEPPAPKVSVSNHPS